MANAEQMRQEGLARLQQMTARRHDFNNSQFMLAEQERKRLEHERAEGNKWYNKALKYALPAAASIGGAALGSALLPGLGTGVGAAIGGSLGGALGAGASEAFVPGETSALAMAVPNTMQTYYLSQMNGQSNSYDDLMNDYAQYDASVADLNTVNRHAINNSVGFYNRRP